MKKEKIAKQNCKMESRKKKGIIIAIVCVLLICVGAAVIINKANAAETEKVYYIYAYDRFFADPNTGEMDRTSEYTNVFEVLCPNTLYYITGQGDMYYTNDNPLKRMDWNPTVFSCMCAEDLYTSSRADYILGSSSNGVEAIRWFVLNMWTNTSGSNSEEISEEIKNNIEEIVGEEIECSDFELKVANQLILRALTDISYDLDEIRNIKEELTMEFVNRSGDYYYPVSEDLQKYCDAYIEQIELILDRKEPTKGIKDNQIPSVRIDKTQAEQKNEDNYYLFGPYTIIGDTNSYDAKTTIFTGNLAVVVDSSGNKIINNQVDCNEPFYIKWEKSQARTISDFTVTLLINKKKIITEANLYYNENELKLDDLNKKPFLGVTKELYENRSTSYIYIDVKTDETTTSGGSSESSGNTSGGSSGSSSGGTGTTTPTTKGSDLVVTQEILSIGGTNHTTDNYKITLQPSTYNSNDFKYSSIKSAVEATAGSEVTYRITVYNEGDEDGYFKELTLYLRDELEYKKITVPSKETKVGSILYKWGADITVDDSDKNAIKFKFNYSDKGQLLEAYNGSEMKAYYIDVTCKISEDLTERRHLTSRTEITEYGSNASELDSKSVLDFDTTKAFIDKYGLTLYYSDGSKSNLTIKEDKNTYDIQDDNDFVILFVEGKEVEETYVDFVLTQEVLKVDGNEDGCETDNYNIEKTSNKFTYKSNKKACEVKPGSKVTYRATVYNEGNKDGYLNEISIYLPDGVEYTGISKPTEEAVNTMNANTQNTGIIYKWGADITVDDSNEKVIKIKFNQKIEPKGQKLEAYNKTVVQAYYIDIICNVTENINNNTVLTSRAEISDYASFNSENIYTRTSMDDGKAIYEVDKDSCGYTKFGTLEGYLSHIETVNNIKLKDLDTKGQLDKSKYDNQDDDDFSRIIVKKGITDLVLTQEILSIDNEAYNLDNYEVTLESGGATDLTYKSNKKTVEVNKGSTIKYRITAYNESEVTGYVSKIKIHLSEDLKFDKNDSGAIIISNPESEIINYRTGAKVEVLEYDEENNIITIGINVYNTNPGPGQQLLGKKDNILEALCIDIICTVDENAQNDEILSCVAEIKEYAAYGSNGYYNKVKDTEDYQVDRDSHSYSIFGSVDEYFKKLNIDLDKVFEDDTFKLWKCWYDIQDDDDFVRVKVKVPKLDVSLTKSILRYSVEGLESLEIERTSIRKNQYRVSKTTESNGLKANDYIVYGVDIHNEGEIEAGAYEIIEYVPEGLKLTGVKLSVADEVNFNLYTSEQEYEKDTTSNCYYYDAENKKAYIKLAGLGEAGLLNIYDGNIENFENNKLRIEVTCEVTENAPQATEIISITEISKYITKSGEWIETIEGIEKTQDKIIEKDMDSTGRTLENNLETYKEYVASAKPFITRPMSEDTENPINEDDQDYAEIIITSYTDLALRCFITSVGDTEYDRKPTDVIDSRSSGNLMKYKTIMYSNTKQPLQVTVGDTITYTIRVYNEGYQQAEATEIKYYIPQGLEIIDVSEHDENCTCTNCTYGWEIHETTESGVTIAKSRYLEGKTLDKTGASGIAKLTSIMASLASTTGTADERYINYINEATDQIPFYRDVQIQCRVTEEIYNKGTAYLGSIAEISEYNSEDGQTDFDSKANDLLDNRTYEQMEENVIGLSQVEDSFDSIYYYFNQVRYNLYDDTDFEVIQVPEKLPIKLQLVQVDAEDSENKINGEKFKIGQKEYITQTINNNKGLIEMNSEVYKKTTYAYTISEIATENTSVLAELENDLRLRVQVDLNENYEFEVEKIILNEIINGEEMSNPLSVNLTSHSAIVKAKLTDGTSVLVKAEYDESTGTIKLLVPNRVKRFDLSLQNFVTEIGKEETNTQENQTTSENSEESVKVNYTKVTGRYPKFTIDENGKYVYNSANTAEPLQVNNGDIVVYTIRVYNEGEIDGYVEEIMNEIPENLQFLTKNNINTQYGWKMYREVTEGEQVTNKNSDSKTLTIGDATLSYIEYNGKTYVETENAELADYVVTTYLSQENGTAGENQENTNLINYFDITKYNEGKISGPSYKDVKIAFKVTDPGENREITNNAQITKYKAIDRQGNETEMNDSDSTPNVWEQDSRADDQGTEKIKVLGFDLSLKKCITSAIIIDNGKQTIYEGNKSPDEEKQIIKVDIPKNKIDDVSLKFKYTIRVYNEGDIAGFAKEITEYIPQGLRFDASEQTNITYGWTNDGDGKVTTNYLEDKELQKGEYADIEIVLVWINGENNMNLKTNIAEISETYNNSNNTPDKDSTPNNLELEEDDIDTAEVLIAPRTGSSINTMYIVLAAAVVALITTGTILIRKFVISKN